MKYKKILLFSLGILLIAYLFYYMFNNDNDKVCFEDNCFNVEIADTSETRELGLMFREKLDEDAGMLFIFENEGSYPFWMKNTLIPLDIIWIDSSGKIVDIREAIPCESEPCQVYYHSDSAKYVLEINKGLSAELGIEIGNMVSSNLIG